MDYTPTESAMPPKDEPIEWIAPDGCVVRGKWMGGAIWVPEGTQMYVYYRPAMWRKLFP